MTRKPFGKPEERPSQLSARLEAAQRHLVDLTTAHEELFAAYERVCGALRSVSDGVQVCDERGNVVFSTLADVIIRDEPLSETMVGQAVRDVSAAAAMGRSEFRHVDLYGPPRRTLEVAGKPVSTAGSRPGGVGRPGEYRSAAAERSPNMTAETPGRPPQSRDAVLGTVAVVHDVSDRERIDAIRRDFVSNISHELRTPVGALSVLAETMTTETSAAVLRRLASRVETEAQRLGHTISDLLSLAQIEAAEGPRPEPCSIREVVDQAVERTKAGAAQREVLLRVDEVSTQAVVLGDRRQLVTALTNLLDNAVKYSDPGLSVRLSVHLGVDVTVEVTDEGIGIPARDRERIFERFYRVDRARARDTGGTGLGLAIVRHVAVNHGGEVSVRSIEGHGSTFSLRIPAISSMGMVRSIRGGSPSPESFNPEPIGPVPLSGAAATS